MEKTFASTQVSQIVQVRRTLKVSTQFVGFHCYPEAPDDVAFLRKRHRHIFHVTATFDVVGDNRELEFFQVQRLLKAFCASMEMDMLSSTPTWSCEQIAEQVHTFMLAKYPTIRVVEVSEDNENSATYEVIPTHA